MMAKEFGGLQDFWGVSSLTGENLNKVLVSVGFLKHPPLPPGRNYWWGWERI